ncbi:Phosphoribosyl-dephospho-CoA transferase [compost metagenome]
MDVTVHDLLRISKSAPLKSEQQVPDWVEASLERANWVVVRRDIAQPGYIPIGIRGATRSQRFPAYLPAAAVQEIIKPEDLVSEKLWTVSPRSSMVEAYSVLKELTKYYAAHGYIWGPTGSIGFELAAGVPTARPESDIDIVIRAPLPLDRTAARNLLLIHQYYTQKIDVQLEAPSGAISLTEYARGSEAVLMRTNSGPYLVKDPWAIS